MRVLVVLLLVGSARRHMLALPFQNTDSKSSFLFEMPEWSMLGGRKLVRNTKNAQDHM
jgi:hypothetical protein